MKHLDLFSGIGGFALAAEMIWDNVEHTFCEIEPFCQAVLKKHWPDAEIYGDIRSLTYATVTGCEHTSTEGVERPQTRSRKPTREVQSGYAIDLLTGGFPCQPFSQAGRRLGTADDRHLWPEMLRVIREFHPRWVVGENVGGFVTWNDGMVLEQVHADLEGEGYEVQAFIIPAVAVNAPHRRDRVWIVANCTSKRSGPRGAERKGQQRETTSFGRDSWNENWVEVAARLCTLDDGLPNGLARPRGWRNAALKGAGNAIVPQVAAEIMRAIKEIDEAEETP